MDNLTGGGRHPAEGGLEKSEETFRLLVDAVADYAIFALSPEGIILSWNAGAQRLKGYSPGEVIGTSFTRFYTPEDIARNHPQWELEEAARNGAYEEEGWRVRKDGTRMWANVVITALRSPGGTLRGFGKVTRDLTQRKIAEEKLRESEERFRLLVSSVLDYAIITLDPEGRVTTWNAGAGRIKGYSPSEIIGHHFSEFYPRKDVENGKPDEELRIAESIGRYEEEGWRVRKDGSEFWASVTITAMRDENKKLKGFAKVTRDLTERKIAEEKLAKSYHEMENRVIERTAELEKAKERAEQSLRARDEFFSIASHELRTPLTSLKLKSQMARRSLKPEALNIPEGAKFQKYVRETDEQLDRLVRLVDDMLDLTRVSQGRLPMAVTKIELSEIARESVERMTPLFLTKHTPIEYTGEGPAYAIADRLRIEQIILNLLTNALRYAPGKPVKVSVERKDEIVRIVVEDRGPGIAPENHGQIFNRYERLAGGVSAAGLGIGLYLSRFLVEAHGGTLTVESELEKGARFIVELPEAGSPKGAEVIKRHSESEES